MKRKSKSRFRVAVIGAGWAGLSSAAHLCTKAEVTLFEAGKVAGGRARSLSVEKSEFKFLDNGQHILLGAYHSVLNVLTKVGVDVDSVFFRCPLQWHIFGGVNLQTKDLPAPFNLLWSILSAKGCTTFEKIALTSQMRNLQKWRQNHTVDMTVDEWLRHQNVSAKWVRDFWHPLVVGALNTPLRTASLSVLANVLHHGVWSRRENSDYLIPLQNLTTLFANPVLSYLKKHQARVFLETRVPRLITDPSGGVWVNDQLFDAAILATAPYHAEGLLPENTPPFIQAAYVDNEYHAITTIYLSYAEIVTLPSVMTGLPNSIVQWFIGRGQLGLDGREVVAIISVSETVGTLSSQEWVQRAHKELLMICPYLSAPIHTQVVTEKRATVASSVNRYHPDMAWLYHQNIYPAGDYLHPLYSATLEGAVQTGQNAAELCINNLSTKG